MDANLSSEKEKPGLMGETNDEKHAKKAEEKLRFRHLPDEILEKYRLMSAESCMYKRQYEEAAFKTYATRPAGSVA